MNENIGKRSPGSAINTWYFPGVILFLAAVLIGMLTYQDYGIAWDEPEQRDLGVMSYDYVTKGDTAINANIDKRLGTGFELPLVFVERSLHLSDMRDVYLSRHFATHLFFLIAAFCMYVLAYRMFGSKQLASLAFIMLAFHPRLYAHSFFNSKDIPFLSAFLIALLFCQVAFQKNKLLWYVLAGFACAYATSIRSMGILLVPSAGMFFLFDLITIKEKKGTVVVNFFSFTASFCVMLYICWPYLWISPFHNFADAFASLAGIFWPGKVLFQGAFYSGDKLPASYMPVWFGITVPEIWLAAGLAGIVWVLADFAKHPARYLRNTSDRNFGLYIACFSLPVIAMIALHGVNIDDWRHLYFIYPPFVMLALFTINKLAKGKLKWIIIPLCSLQVVLIGVFMVRDHPHQQVYFNNLVSHKPEFLRKNYDLEYWGCSYKQALEHLMQQYPGTISIARDYVPLTNNIMMLQDRDRKRITITDHGADFMLTDFRLHPEDYPYPQEYSIKVLNSTIMCVYKMK